MSEILRVESVFKRFRGLTAVRDVSFSVSDGELTGLIGPNGAGKTTLFTMIAGFADLSEGAVYYRDQDISKKRSYEINRMGVARTFQIVQPLMDLTVIENVMVGVFYGRTGCSSHKAAYEKAREILAFTGIEAQKDVLARTLGTPGRKRLELARALATTPDLLLLDEVMAGLTPTEVEKAMRLIEQINDRGITIVLVEHVMQAVMSICKRVLVLHHGELIADGTPAQVSSDGRVIDVYLGEGNNDAEG